MNMDFYRNYPTWTTGSDKEDHAKRRRGGQSSPSYAYSDMYVPSCLIYFWETEREANFSFVVCYHKAKALELFLALVIEKSSAITAERGSKKVEVYHLYVSQLPSHIPTEKPFFFDLPLENTP